MVPHPPPAGTVPFLGATCGVIGSVQVTEAIKYLAGQGMFITNRLFLWDGLQGEGGILTVACETGCPACGSAIKGVP
jgi:molybdopterin/thiamine biosynthesis adenylyltransferase